MQIDATFVKCRNENIRGRCRQTYVYGARGDDSRPFDAFYWAGGKILPTYCSFAVIPA